MRLLPPFERMIPVLLFTLLFALPAAAQQAGPDFPVYVELSEEEGFDRVREPVEIGVRLEVDSDLRLSELFERAAREFRVVRLRDGEEVEDPSQLFDLRLGGSGRTLNARILFFADVEAGSSARYRIDRGSAGESRRSGLSVRGEGVGRVIENDYFRIETDPVSGQIDQIDLKFADRPSFRFEPGNMHWNPDFIIVPEEYPERSYSWPAARNMEHPDYEVEAGPLFFEITRRQFVPGQDKVFVTVKYRFYAGLPWFLMESRMEAVREFRTFGVRNDELAFGVGDFTHAGWRTESLGLHPRHRGGLGAVPLFDDSRAGRHLLGSSLSAWLPWLSYSHNERGFAAASLRLGWDNRNLLTGEQAPLENARTVLSNNNGAPYWFRSLVYTPRRAHTEAFFNLDQETINEMVRIIPRGSSYFERNAYYFYPFDRESGYEPVDELYLRLTRPLQVQIVSSE